MHPEKTVSEVTKSRIRNPQIKQSTSEDEANTWARALSSITVLRNGRSS